LGIYDLEKQIDGIRNCNGINLQAISDLDKRMNRETTTQYGDRLNRLVADVAEIVGIRYSTLITRLNNGWSVERALNK
jgi:hypothetical protein